MPNAAPTFRPYGEEAGRPDFRKSAAARGYDGKWNRARGFAVRRDKGLCVHCLKQGITKEFDEVDHIVPVRMRSDLRLSLGNLQCLCKLCHARKTQQDVEKYRNG